MKLYLAVPSVIAAAALLGGCAAIPTNSGTGMLYTETQDAVTATPNAGASKEGRACADNILGLLVRGDSSIEAAKQDAGITKVASVDRDVNVILGVYGTNCTVVRGE
ncbi:MAG: TRL-like family protein [Pseudomonadota bacterium]